MATKVVPTLFLLLAVLAVGRAQKKCCFPSQFVVNSGGLIQNVKSGMNVNTHFYGQGAFDVPKNRQSQITYVKAAGQLITSLTITDYSAHVEYVIVENIKSCNKVPVTSDFMHCVPDNAVYAGQMYLGDHKLNANMWTFFLNQGGVSANVTLTLSAEECIPLSVILDGTAGGVPTLQLFGFSNFTKGIADPAKFFTVPKYCPQDFDHEIPDSSIPAMPKIF